MKQKEEMDKRIGDRSQLLENKIENLKEKYQKLNEEGQDQKAIQLKEVIIKLSQELETLQTF